MLHNYINEALNNLILQRELINNATEHKLDGRSQLTMHGIIHL